MAAVGNYEVITGSYGSFTNIGLDTLAPGIVLPYLLSLPGAAAGKMLAINGTGDDFEWVTP